MTDSASYSDALSRYNYDTEAFNNNLMKGQKDGGLDGQQMAVEEIGLPLGGQFLSSGLGKFYKSSGLSSKVEEAVEGYKQEFKDAVTGAWEKVRGGVTSDEGLPGTEASDVASSAKTVSGTEGIAGEEGIAIEGKMAEGAEWIPMQEMGLPFATQTFKNPLFEGADSVAKESADIGRVDAAVDAENLASGAKVENVAEAMGESGEAGEDITEAAVETDVAAGEGLAEAGAEVAAATGGETMGVGAILGGLLILGGTLWDAFGGHDSAPPVAVVAPNFSTPVFQPGGGPR